MQASGNSQKPKGQQAQYLGEQTDGTNNKAGSKPMQPISWPGSFLYTLTRTTDSCWKSLSL